MVFEGGCNLLKLWLNESETELKLCMMDFYFIHFKHTCRMTYWIEVEFELENENEDNSDIKFILIREMWL